MSRDFRDLLAEFNVQGVEYIIVGAHALAAYGHVRATKDLDVWVRPDAENAKRVLRALLVGSDLFNWHLQLPTDELEWEFTQVNLLHPHELDFLINPRRLRGSDFLVRWAQGRWLGPFSFQPCDSNCIVATRAADANSLISD